MAEVITRLHEAGVHTGLGAFNSARHQPAADRPGGARGLRAARRLRAPPPGHRRRPAHRADPDVLAGLRVPRRRRQADRDSRRTAWCRRNWRRPGLPIRAHRDPCPGRTREYPGAEHRRLVLAALAPHARRRPRQRGAVRPLLARRRRLRCSASSPWCPGCSRSTRTATLRGALLGACAMSVAFTAAVFAWFGIAIGVYTRLGAAAGLAGAAAGRAAVPAAVPRLRAGAPPRRPPPRRPSLRALAGACGLGGDRVARAQAARRHPGLRAVSVAAAAPGRRPRRRGRPHLPAAAGERSASRRRSRVGATARARWRRPLALAALACRLLLAGYGAAALSR